MTYEATYWPDPHRDPQRKEKILFEHDGGRIITQAVCRAAAEAASVPGWQIIAITSKGLWSVVSESKGDGDA